MPFKSKAQQKFMFATMPEKAEEWAEETPDIKSLPEKKNPEESIPKKDYAKKKKSMKKAAYMLKLLLKRAADSSDEDMAQRPLLSGAGKGKGMPGGGRRMKNKKPCPNGGPGMGQGGGRGKGVNREKAAFVHSFCDNVYNAISGTGMTVDQFMHTKLACDIVKLAAGKPPMDKIVDMLGLGTPKGQLLTGLSILAPMTLGGVGGAAVTRLTSPSATAIGNIQKEEILARYDAAIEEAKARIAARRARAAL